MWIVALILLLLGPPAARAQDLFAPNADRYFRLEWQATPRDATTTRLSGYIYNEYGSPAANVRLYIEALDRDGRVVATATRPLAGTVPNFGRSAFEVKVPAAAAYRVRVSHWDWLRGGGAG